MKEFWALVDNSRRMRKGGHLRSTVWGKLYIALFVLASMVGFSLLIYRGEVHPFALLIAIPYLLVIGLGLGIGSIRHEWKSQTAAWWLTLPYSRTLLAVAKLAGSFLRLLKISAAAAFIMVFVAFVGMVLNPTVWNPGSLAIVAGTAVKLYLLAIALSPVTIALGMLLAVVLQSRIKPLAPLVWLLIVMLFVTGANRISHIFAGIKNGTVNFSLSQLPFSNILIAAVIGIIALTAISTVLIGASAYILTEHTEA